MRRFVISIFCAALMMNAAFAKENSNDDKKPYKIWGGMMTFPLVVTYDGPVLPRESTAILVIAKDTKINSIDGIRVDDQGQWVNFLKNPTGNSNIVQLLPGRHVIGISYETKIFQGSLYFVSSEFYFEVSFEAAPGHVYLADSNGSAKMTTAWRKPTTVEGSFTPRITEITAELDEKENHNLDGSFKNLNKIYRISDWLAARQKAASEGHLRGKAESQTLGPDAAKNNSFLSGPAEK